MSLTNTNNAVDSLVGTSITALLSSLAVNVVVFAVFMTIFLLARTKFHNVYEPRSYVEYLQPQKRMEKLPRTPWGWVRSLYRIFRDSNKVIERSGMDAYFFMRFLRMILIIFVPGMVITWAILLPLNAIGGLGNNPGPGQQAVTGLDKLAFGNVSRQNTSRYWAHLVLAYIFVAWICVVSVYEMTHFLRIRQKWLVSPKHLIRASATTILVTSIPKSLLDEDSLRRLFSHLPGGVRNIWLNRNYSNLLIDVNNRDAIARQLELAELRLIQRALRRSQNSLVAVDQHGPSESSTRQVVDTLVPRENRPQHRLPLFPWFISLPNWTFLGEKVDTIDWCKEELSRRNPDIANKQRHPELYKPLNSAFIQFNRQIAAHMAVQSVSHSRVKALSPRYLEASPQDVVWTNMQLHWWERYVWTVAAWIMVIAFTVLYLVPVAFIGTLSHVPSLVQRAPWLGFLTKETTAAKVTRGIFTGVLPTLLLTIIVALVPFFMKFAARMQGLPSRPTISLATQDMYFFFLFIQVFIVVTISSGITTVINDAVCASTTHDADHCRSTIQEIFRNY